MIGFTDPAQTRRIYTQIKLEDLSWQQGRRDVHGVFTRDMSTYFALRVYLRFRWRDDYVCSVADLMSLVQDDSLVFFCSVNCI